ncbi:MAG: hypothetical protein J3K34DRAFT_522233 [Monoraphidium minutum]|nr:MAG: hypothetical protein J3K34DRAFT_522233 [Monoraphidium minutum]
MPQWQQPGFPAMALHRIHSASYNGPPGNPARLTTNDALTYLRDVKNKFADKKDVYDTFLEIMKEFKAQRIDTAGVIQRVKDLFRGHKELILGFNTFLPKGFEIQVHEVEDDEPAPAKQPVEFDQAISYVNKIKQRFSQDERVYKAFLEILNMYRKGQKSINDVYGEVAVLFRNHRDLLEEFSYFLPDNSPAQAPARQPARGGWGGGGRGGGRGVSGAMGRGYPPYGYGQGGYGPGGYGPGAAYNKRKGPRPGDADDYARQTALQRELLFFEKALPIACKRVKARLRSKESYQDLLKTLNMYASDIINRGELLSLAQDIIGRFPDLMSGFTQFLQRIETVPGQRGARPPPFLPPLDLKAIAAAGGRLNPRDVARLRAGAGRDRWMNKPVSEVAADMAAEDKSDRCTDSYVKYPAQLPKLVCSGRDALCLSVLNDEWVSVVSGSEDYSFKLMRKNQYEEALFRCEDDRYELDMAIEQNRATLELLRPVSAALGGMASEDRVQYRLPDGMLRAVHFRAIERIYGDQSGPQVCDLLRKNPPVAIPVILGRLEQKDAEWREVREEMNKLWRKVFEQNYNKSLDHRSFYFKQADKKALLTKAMLQEVKDAADKRRGEDDSLRSLAAGCPVAATLQPDLGYDYADSTVFDDVYHVVAYAVEDMLSGESREAVLRFWTRCVEPLFGLPERTYSQLHTKSEPEVRHDAPSSSSEQEATTAPAGRDGDDATSGGRDAAMADATPEPGSTPEPGGGGQLDALLEAAGGAKAAGDGPAGSGEDGSGGRPAGADSQRSDDTTADRFYDCCRPVASRLNASSDPAAPPPPPAARPDWARRRVLYGNDALYYFLRFHHHLYDRMLAARRCARDRNVPTSLFRQPTEADRDAAGSTEAAAEAARLHGEFMGMVRQLIDGSLDPSNFEDQVRSLLGTNSYVLFTLDKLVYKLVKHMQLMVADEQTMRLCELHRYEAARRAPLAEEVYRANANIMLQDDANCYRFEMLQHEAAAELGGAGGGAFAGLSSTPPPPAVGAAGEPKPEAAAAAGEQQQQQGAAGGAAPVKAEAGAAGGSGGGSGREAVALSVQLMDPDRVEVHQAGLDPVFGDYMRGFMGAPAGAEARDGRVFLPRQARRSGAALPGGGADEGRLLALMAGAAVANGLECKISCANSKVSYVLDTEDVMWRRGRRRFAAAGAEFPPAGRRARYDAWMAGRQAALQPGLGAYAADFPEAMAQ